MTMSVRLVPDEVDITVMKEEIMTILFHRGRMLLLDEVTIREGKVIGKFKVPEDNCVGHEPKPGMPVMRGVEIAEMGFLVLGVFIAKCIPLAVANGFDFSEVRKGTVPFSREIIGAKFSEPVYPGDELILETGTTVQIEDLKGTLIFQSGKMVARVGGKRKCTITSVSVVVSSPKQKP